MDDSQDARTALERLIADRGENYADLSRLIGRNPAYIQQFIKRGTPRKLDEDDRRVLARYFGVSEQMLGGAAVPIAAAAARMRSLPAVVAVPRLALGVSIIRVDGESMAPTLSDGDDIMVDHDDDALRLRDGVYVLRLDGVLMVKRIAIGPLRGRFSVVSDNVHYPDWADIDPALVDIVGRVVWTGRRLV